jgi:hypothetical protein
MPELSASQQIDAIVKLHPGWKGETLARLRTLIREADPEMVEEVKWKKPSRPEGVPVWFHNGNICMCDILKKAVRLTFPKGAALPDPHRLFNTRLDSQSVRAIDWYEHDTIDEAALQSLIAAAVALSGQNALE